MHTWRHGGGIPMVTHPSHFFKSMTMHQARIFSFADATSEGFSDALTRLNTGINGDDTTASSPIVPADLLIKSRRLKPLLLSSTQTPFFHVKTETAFDRFSRLQSMPNLASFSLTQSTFYYR